jgi:hypothetical protein
MDNDPLTYINRYLGGLGSGGWLFFIVERRERSLVLIEHYSQEKA